MIIHKQLRERGFIREHDGWSQSFHKSNGIVRIDLNESLDDEYFDIFVSNHSGCTQIGRTKRITDIGRVVKSIEPLK